jgi:4-hydroxy-2-oxoglutarate aldolase
MARPSICKSSTSFYRCPISDHYSRSHDERNQAISLTRTTLDENGFKHVLVIAGTGAQSTRETKKICADAKDAPASHALVLTPSTWPPQMTVDNSLRFHREVSRYIEMHVVICNLNEITLRLQMRLRFTL